MFPANPINDATNIVSTSAESCSDIPLRNSLMGKLSNLPNLIFRKSSKWVFLAKIAASLPCFIGHIISMGSKKKMIGIYARRIITSMKNVLALGKLGSLGQFPHKVMGEYNFSTIPNSSISVTIFASGPEPAMSIHGYIIPLETIWL